MSFCTLALTFSHLLGVDLVPYATKQNIFALSSFTCTIQEIELFTALNSFAGVLFKLTMPIGYFVFLKLQWPQPLLYSPLYYHILLFIINVLLHSSGVTLKQIV